MANNEILNITKEYDKIKKILPLIPRNRKLTILDVGCGYGYWAFILRIWCHPEPYIVGVDIYEPPIRKMKKMGLYDELFNIDILHYDSDKIFDIVIMGEIIEHLEKEDGYTLLEKMESMCRGKLIITTPNGYVPAGVGKDFVNPSAIHLSGWTEKNFQDLGYSTTLYSKTGKLTRSIALLDDIRRRLFRLPSAYGIIAEKGELADEEIMKAEDEILTTIIPETVVHA